MCGCGNQAPEYPNVAPAGGELARFQEMEAALNKQVIGQKEAVQAVTQVVHFKPLTGRI